MAKKIAVESGNPYRDPLTGFFGTAPDAKLKDSLAASSGAKAFLPKGSFEKKAGSMATEATNLLKNLRNGKEAASVSSPNAKDNAKLSPEERTALIERFNELQGEIGVYFKLDQENGGLTAEQAKEIEALRMEQSDIDFRVSTPAKLEKVAPESETNSTLSPEVVVAAYNDKLQNKEAHSAIDQAFGGTYFDADTPVDEIMNGKNKDITPEEFYDTFSNTRDALRTQYGDTVPVYRAEGKQKEKYTKNWATTEAFVSKYGDNIVKEDVPVDNIIAVNVFKSGKYHELIVGEPPKSSLKDKPNAEAGEFKPSGTQAEAEAFVKDSVMKDTLYHGTTPENANSITDTGFDTEKSKSEKIFGNGVYLAGNKEVADWYALSASPSGSNGSTLGIKVNVKNPYIDDMNKFDNSIGDDTVNKFTFDMYNWGVDNEKWTDARSYRNNVNTEKAFNEFAKDFGDHLLETHDAIIQTNSRGVEIMVVKDPKNIMVIK